METCFRKWTTGRRDGYRIPEIVTGNLLPASAAEPSVPHRDGACAVGFQRILHQP